MKRVRKKSGAAREGGSPKPNAIVLAGLQLFTRYGYRKTSIDDIARAAQVAKRTVYLHFENKAAVFLAILEYLGDQVRQRGAAAERAGGTAALSPFQDNAATIFTIAKPGAMLNRGQKRSKENAALAAEPCSAPDSTADPPSPCASALHD